MNISVRAHGFERSDAIDTFVRNDIRSTLARFRDEVLSVDVFLKDANGPKGGVDKQALLRIQMRSGQQLVLQTVREDLYAAIRISTKRAKRAVRRSLRKTRHLDKLSLRRFFADAPV